MKMNPRDMDWKDFVHADHLTSLRDDDDSDDGDDDAKKIDKKVHDAIDNMPISIV